jgi:hypothetical protein
MKHVNSHRVMGVEGALFLMLVLGSAALLLAQTLQSRWGRTTALAHHAVLAVEVQPNESVPT